jgi:hypothetical protein
MYEPTRMKYSSFDCTTFRQARTAPSMSYNASLYPSFGISGEVFRGCEVVEEHTCYVLVD